MATAKRAKATAEAKELKLVCKCGDCTHWEIILVKGGKREEYRQNEYIKCMTCGTEISCYFSTGAHEGIHYERHRKNER